MPVLALLSKWNEEKLNGMHQSALRGLKTHEGMLPKSLEILQFQMSNSKKNWEKIAKTIVKIFGNF